MSIDLQDELSKSRNQEIGYSLTDVFMGVGWCRKKVESPGFLGFGGGIKEVDIDLDVACLLFNRSGKLVDQVWYEQLSSRDAAVTHSGDDNSGGGGPDTENERISVDLQQVHPTVQTLVFIVTSPEKEPFAAIPHAFCVLVDAIGDEEIDRVELSVEGGEHTGLIMAMVCREDEGWRSYIINRFLHTDSHERLLAAIAGYL